MKEFYFNNILDGLYDAVDKTIECIKPDIFQAVVRGLPIEQSRALARQARAQGRLELDCGRRGLMDPPGGARCGGRRRNVKKLLKRQRALVEAEESAAAVAAAETDRVLTEEALEAMRKGAKPQGWSGKKKRKSASVDEAMGGFAKKKAATDVVVGHSNNSEEPRDMPQLYD